ncbi:MAG: hypothetical protein V2I54_03585 [Bacteroidales bacterium]|jgi:hypothetical protein|nr:hypothetical protein [Bacteroidales bacterium]
MSTTKKENSQLKIHTGFRLSKTNYKLLEELENELGINKTSVINLILALIKNDKKVLVNLFRSAIDK